MADWTSEDLRAWRDRLRWSQSRAADALVYDVAAFKKLERGTRPITERTRRMAALVEREHVRTMISVTGEGAARQAFSTGERAAERLAAMEAEGGLMDRGGRRHLVYLSLFSGLGACTAAMERIGAGAVCAGYADVDAASNAVLRHRWPDTPRLGDVTTADLAPLRGRVDLIVGGPPCQSFSVAGRRLGLADPRGNLLLHYARAIGVVLPRWFVLENVPGLRTANNGDDFGVLQDALESLGYAIAWRELDARGFGLPQRRRRLWIVGERAGSASGPLRALALPESDRRGAAPRPTTRRGRWKRDAARVEGGPDQGVEPDIDWSLADAWLQAREAPHGAAAGGAPGLVGNVVAFKANQGSRSRSLGASSSAAPTLNAASGGNRVPAIAYVAAADLRHGTVGDVASTLQVGPTGSGWSLNAQPVAVHADGAGSTIVRRFSVRECERLQGLDDDWTAGGKVGGKPLTDGERYRLLGNAWAVPVAAWVFERLISVTRSTEKRREQGDPRLAAE